MKGNKSLLLSMMLFLVLIFLSGCGEKTVETIYAHLEKAVVLEEMFKEQQKPLLEAEEQEHKIYEQIISLGMSEFDEIVKLSQEAGGLVDKRTELIEKEKESIEAGYAEFKKVADLVANLEEQQLVDAANEMMEKMEQRYQAYQSLYTNYKKALQLDKELYEMLQKKDLTIDQLQEHIDKINEAYEDVIADKEVFNRYTEEYNELKKTFYKKSNLNVNYQ